MSITTAIVNNEKERFLIGYDYVEMTLTKCMLKTCFDEITLCLYDQKANLTLSRFHLSGKPGLFFMKKK